MKEERLNNLALDNEVLNEEGTNKVKSGCPIHAAFLAGCEYCQQINDMLDEQFAEKLQTRHMSDWTDAEMHDARVGLGRV